MSVNINGKNIEQRKYSIAGTNNRFSYQLLDPNNGVTSSLIEEKRGPFRYEKAYPLFAKRDGSYIVGSILAEWFHRTDRFIVQAVNTPTRNNCYSEAWVKYKALGHEIKPKMSLLMLMDIRMSKTEQTELFNCRVRHVPTKTQFFDWDNYKLPRFTVVRKGHEKILRKFLGDRLLLDGVDGGSPFEGELLKRIDFTREQSTRWEPVKK
jgi:hypothetical protein